MGDIAEAAAYFKQICAGRVWNAHGDWGGQFIIEENMRFRIGNRPAGSGGALCLDLSDPSKLLISRCH